MANKDKNIAFLNEEDDMTASYSMGIPQDSKEKYGDHAPISNSFDSPISPISKSTSTQITLSKKLFNLEHYITIPLMFMLAFFVYYDRGGLASALDTAQLQLFNNSAFEGGAVASCYLFGYCFTSPIFAVLGSKYPPLKMSGIGMFIWCLGAFMTGWPSPSFISHFVWLAFARLLTGIGEAGFLSFAGTIIDIIAPDSSRSLWLGTFYMGIPLGYAMGYAVGGTIVDMNIYTTKTCDSAWFDSNPDATDCNESWRAVFIIESFIVLPLCFVLYCMQSPANMLLIKQAKDELDEQSLQNDSNMSLPSQHKQKEQIVDSPVSVKLLRLLKNRTFVFTCAGYALQTFVTGTFAVEAIVYLQKVYGWNSGKAGTTFGIITFVSGVAGSVVGGLVLDKMKAKLPEDSPPFLYCRPALKLLVFLSFISFPFGFIVTVWNSIPIFIIGAALTEFFIFASTGPVNNVILWCVLYEDRPLAAALNTLAIHAFGDAMAPIAVGAIITQMQDNGKSDAFSYNFAFGIAVFWLIFSAFAFIGGVWSCNWLQKWMKANGGFRRPSSLLLNDPSH